MRTITAMFDNRADAESARDRLTRAGIGEHDIAIHDRGSLGNTSQQSADAGGHGGFSDVKRPAGGVYGSEFATTTDYRGDIGLRQRRAEAGSDVARHRNALGDFVDEGGRNIADKDHGMHRNALGDFIDTSGHRIGDDDHDTHHPGHEPSAWQRITAFFAGDSAVYEEGMRRGGIVLTAHVADNDAGRATEILESDGVVDLDERAESWRNQGWAGGSGSGGADAVTATGRPRVRSYDFDRGSR